MITFLQFHLFGRFWWTPFKRTLRDKVPKHGPNIRVFHSFPLILFFRHRDGCAQRIARHPFFDNLTILVVMANSVWLGVDADLNQAGEQRRIPSGYLT